MGASLCSGFFSQIYLSTRENVHEAYFLSKNTFMKQFCKNLYGMVLNDFSNRSDAGVASRVNLSIISGAHLKQRSPYDSTEEVVFGENTLQLSSETSFGSRRLRC
jgi:hypothetical protein